MIPQIGDMEIGNSRYQARTHARSHHRMRAEPITCPDCGLVVTLMPVPGGSTLLYDLEEWRRRCRQIALGGPVWCLVARDVTKPKA